MQDQGGAHELHVPISTPRTPAGGNTVQLHGGQPRQRQISWPTSRHRFVGRSCTTYLTGAPAGDTAIDLDVVEFKNLANYVNGTSFGCTNPSNLHNTALIDTAASCTLLTACAPATPAPIQHAPIAVVQHGGGRMTTTHAVDLLLRNLPKTARLGHRLPGLVNNLLSVATLIDSRCDIYFHRTGCEVSFDGKVILWGWRDPTNRLWRVRITDDSWTTHLCVSIPPDTYEPPLILLSTAPTTATDHLVNHIEVHTTAPHRVTFTLSSVHINRDSTEYRRGHHVRNHVNRTVHPRILSATKQPDAAFSPLSSPSLRGCSGSPSPLPITEETGFSFLHSTGSPSPLPATAIANSLYECSNTHKLIHFYYACLNFPVKSTLLLTIKAGYLKGFPGLTADRVRCHIDVNVASERGHMDQVRQGQRSTHHALSSIPIVLPHHRVDSNMDTPPQQPSNERTQHVFLSVHDFTGDIASDQTGCFPVTSNRGNAYLALFYIFDPNYIKSVPIRNRSKEELLCAYTEVYAWLTARGYRPLLHKLDNETSRDVKAFVAAEQVKIQYTPPDMHRTNPAERAVRTWKNHFTAGIVGIPPSFPIAN